MQKCILIYDDDLGILQLCEIILKKANYQVETLSRCENIIADIELFKPDMILIDLWIPEIGGEKAIALMKKKWPQLGIPVILFSANVEIVEICKKVNADGYLKKPFDISALKHIVDTHVG